jgi:hypothetical protein
MLIWCGFAVEQQERHHDKGRQPEQKRHEAKALHNWSGPVHCRIFSSVFRGIGDRVLPPQIVLTGALGCHANLPFKAR